MSLTPNIPETMIPGTYTGYNYFAGPNGLPANIQKVLLLGDISSEGSLAVNKPTAVSTEAEALALAGAGSVLMQMYKAAKNAWKYAQITLCRHAAVTGSAAKWASTVSGSATGAGAVSFIINGKKVSAGVAKNDAAAAVATALADAINADVDLPVTAAASTATVTLTAKCKGEYIANGTFGTGSSAVTISGGISVSAESKADGISVGTVTATAGTGEVDLTSALAAAFPERYHLIVTPVCDARNLPKLVNHVEAAAAPLEQRGQRVIGATVVSSASAGVAVNDVNHERLHIAAVKNKINSTAWEIAAGLGAIFASNSQPNVPMNGVAIPGLATPEIEDKWSGEEQDVLLYGGVIPLVEEDSRLCIVRAVTTKCRNGNTRFTKLIDTGVIASLDYLRDSIISMHTNKYKNKVIHALLADAINEDNKQVCRDLEDVKILRFIDEYDDQFITEESTSEPGRMLCQIPAPVVPGLNQIYSTIDLYL
ncbi:MAG: phage tail sheath subtilisin-like domain-containing protein [Fibrobacter sp.]|nr:phage tail sheath subtilisin-like domain-containing protein [Fibrobacter sp.]